ncbi:bifunctional glycosyltransferase/CDP-glycerol:glycerophosphate glycerophosphotransferase [Corynebacterium casei]|uniref:bifunctional glycosyltransferase/CDP-glycerol:glycerophosphate glycerophosphotransferase n=1 Tax=Corynebacterium casei TaxID=160386 RepID=UPI003FD3EBBB
MQNRITVAVTAYNNEDSIEAALKSALGQSMPGVEVIVVNDCSGDGTEEVIAAVSQQHPELRVLSTNENSGSAAAPRNLAITNARSPYITFLDGDDVLDRNACLNLFGNAVDSDADIVTAHMVRKKVSSGAESGWHRWLLKSSRTLTSADELPDLVYDSTSTAKAYKLEFLHENNLEFPVGKYFEDNNFSQRAYSLAKTIRMIPDVVYYWLVYPADERLTITSDWTNLQAYEDRIEAFFVGYRAYESVGEHKIANKLLEKTLKHDIWLFIDAAKKAGDLKTFMQLWRAAEPVTNLATDDVLRAIPLKQRAKVAALRLGDLEAFDVANNIGIKGTAKHGKITDGIWLAPGWESKDLLESGVDRWLFAETAVSGLPEIRRNRWHHQCVEAKSVAGGIELSGFTTGEFQQFAEGQPIQVIARLALQGGEWSQSCLGEVTDILGTEVYWKFRIDRLLEDSGLRNAAWDLSLTLAQEQLTVTQKVAGYKGFKKAAFSIGSFSIKSAPLDRFAIALGEGGNLFMRRWSRDLPVGLGTRVVSTLSRGESKVRGKVLSGVSKDEQLKLAGKISRALPLQKKLVVFESHMGKQFSDSPRAVYEELKKKHPDWNFVWSFTSRDFDNGCTEDVVVRHSLAYVRLLSRAEVVVDNQGFPTYYNRRSDQLYLQTWHGVPLKTMGRDFAKKRNSGELHQIKKSVDNWSVTFSPSSYYQRHLNEAMLFDGPTISANLPRNDVLLTADKQSRSRVLTQLGLPLDKKYVLWAPTFREQPSKAAGHPERLLDVKKLMRQLPDDVVLLIRGHYLNAGTNDRNSHLRVVDVNDVQEISALYLAADVLMTDFSSVMFDFALTRKPIVIYAPDYEDYRDTQRGLNFDLSSRAPGAFIPLQDNLAETLLSSLDREQVVTEAYEDFIRDFCGEMCADGAAKAVEYIEEWRK